MAVWLLGEVSLEPELASFLLAFTGDQIWLAGVVKVSLPRLARSGYARSGTKCTLSDLKHGMINF
jgi:hypothetical protein